MCPYRKCDFRKWGSREEIYDHFWFVNPSKVTNFGVVTKGTMSRKYVLVNRDDMKNIKNEDSMQIIINDAFRLFKCSPMKSHLHHRLNIEMGLNEVY